MKLAVSNIAWSDPDDPVLLAKMAALGVTGIEVAPTKYWPDWAGATSSAARAQARKLADLGFAVPAFQAIVFAKPDLQIFGSREVRQAFVDHMANVAELAAEMGAATLVFGAPKNRKRGDLPEADAEVRAAELFVQIGGICAKHGACLGIEPNPTDYACDFMTNTADAARVVRLANHPGVRLHLDTAGMKLAEDDADKSVRENADILAHLHASEPFLGDFSDPQSDHALVAAALEDIGYTGWISIEMRAQENEHEAVLTAVRHVQSIYGTHQNR